MQTLRSSVQEKHSNSTLVETQSPSVVCWGQGSGRLAAWGTGALAEQQVWDQINKAAGSVPDSTLVDMWKVSPRLLGPDQLLAHRGSAGSPREAGKASSSPTLPLSPSSLPLSPSSLPPSSLPPSLPPLPSLLPPSPGASHQTTSSPSGGCGSQPLGCHRAMT